MVIIMNGMIIRDPVEMNKFASEIDNYCSEMKNVCNKMKGHLSSASSGMKDELSQKALQRVEELIDDLLAGLPTASDAADKLRVSAKKLFEAQEIKVR